MKHSASTVVKLITRKLFNGSMTVGKRTARAFTSCRRNSVTCQSLGNSGIVSNHSIGRLKGSFPHAALNVSFDMDCGN